VTAATQPPGMTLTAEPREPPPPVKTLTAEPRERRHLTILAVDLTGPDAKFGETFDQWAAEDLMDAVALIDLADAGRALEAPVTWVRAQDSTTCTLEEVLTGERWPAVTFVSVRPGPLSSIDSIRCDQELELLDAVRSSFLSGCEFRAYTVSCAEPEGDFGPELFDPRWDAHFLHDLVLIADPEVAVLPLRARDRPSACLLTALLVAGGFRWFEEPVLSLHDDPAGKVTPVRLIRTQLRVVNSGHVVDDVLAGAFPESGPWIVPPGINAIPASHRSPIEPEVSARIADASGFAFRRFQAPPTHRASEIGVLKGLRLFLRNFIAAAKKAPLLVIDQFATRVGEGVAAAAQHLTFGEHSKVVMRFRPGMSNNDSDNLLFRLQEVGMPDTGPPAIPDPKPWILLREAAFGLVDGGDLPEGVPTPMHDTQRLLYLDPAAVGPAPDDAAFSLSDLEVELLDLGTDLSEIGSMDVVNARAVEAALARFTVGADDNGESSTDLPLDSDAPSKPDQEAEVSDDASRPEYHRPDHPEFDPTNYLAVAAFYQGPSDVVPDQYGTHQTMHKDALREHELIDGPWKAEGRCDHCGTSFHHGVCYRHTPSGLLVNIGHICARKSSLPIPDKDPSRMIVLSLQDRWRSWLMIRRNCLLWQVGNHLATAIDDARQSLANGMVEREAPDSSMEDVEAAQAKLRLATLRNLALSVLTGLGTVANLIFSFFPFFWILIPFAGFVVGLLARGLVLTRELARVQTRQGAGLRTRKTALLKIQHSSTELARLINTRDQFYDWQAVIRTVAHRPFGSLLDAGEVSDETVTIDRPQSFVLSTSIPNQEQITRAQMQARLTSFKSNWLSEAFLQMREQWQGEYKRDVLWTGGGALEPESDNSPAGAVRARIPGTNEEVFSPREDFGIRVTSNRLHSAVNRVHTDAIVTRLSDTPLDDLISPVTVTGPGRALNGCRPEEFLRALRIPLNEVEGFRPEIFGNDQAALPFKLDNLEMSFPEDESNGDEPPPLFVAADVRPGRALMFVSFRIVLSPLIDPRLLAGYQESPGSDPDHDRDDDGDDNSVSVV
jgi:hypothetical protein